MFVTVKEPANASARSSKFELKEEIVNIRNIDTGQWAINSKVRGNQIYPKNIIERVGKFLNHLEKEK